MGGRAREFGERRITVATAGELLCATQGGKQ